MLDPLLDPTWNADFITDDPEKYLAFVKANRGCELAIDESGETIGTHPKDMMFLATRSRHYGHVATFIAQRRQQIARNVCDQCTRLILFSVHLEDAEILAREWVDDSLLEAHTLKQGECIIKLKFQPSYKINSFQIE